MKAHGQMAYTDRTESVLLSPGFQEMEAHQHESNRHDQEQRRNFFYQQKGYHGSRLYSWEMTAW